MKIAVTGGAGYIGSTLIIKLVDDGDTIVSVDNLTRGDYGHLKAIRAHEKASLIEGDIRNGKLLAEIFEDAEAIAHLAALPGLILCRERPEEATSVNIYGTHQVLETARKLDIGKVVFCSSAAIYGRPREIPVREGHPLRPLNLYGVTKLAGEKLMEVYYDNYGIDTISLRFGNVFGVGLYTNYETVVPKFVKQGLEGNPLTVYGDGKSSRDFVHVGDIVQAIILALRGEVKGGEAFNVGGETMEIDILASLVSESLEKLAGKETSIIHLPPRPGETKYFSYNTEKIGRLLGYKPRWSVNKGVEQIIKYKLGQMVVEG
jgi:UDP-glucose 4-epimerase